MKLHTLASCAGHDVQTMQRYYSHVIARYRDSHPIDLGQERKAARQKLAAKPFAPAHPPSAAAGGAATEALARTRVAHHS